MLSLSKDGLATGRSLPRMWRVRRIRRQLRRLPVARHGPDRPGGDPPPLSWPLRDAGSDRPRITRLFGECDVAAPPDYIREVNRYIDRWRKTPRLEEAVKRAQQNGYPKKIAAAFMARQLPPQYFYLAMEESGLVPTRVGPPTRFGIAKGMWQFIPETGKRYGLQPGPYFREAREDPSDDRFNWERATTAAASYIKDIYATDAQASGLLVMASYNWGERRVIDRLKKMPLNPRERNFWTLLGQHRDDVSSEVYDYVFGILSAAVIGENPRLFGFQFDNPLASSSP
jgi:hypothetical protein